MLSSIHPLGERAKGNRFGLTAVAFVVGSVLGGATVGAVAGGVAVPLRLGTGLPGSTTAAAVVVALALVATGFEATGWPLPSVRRQVDEDWLHRYRGWVYGVGFGFQLGTGVSTSVTSAAVYVTVAAAVLVGDLGASVALMALFGLVRGLSLVPARHIETTGHLVAFHRSLQRRAPTVQRLCTATLGLVAVAATVALVPSLS